MRIALLSASYTAQSLKANAQRCINLYPEANPPDAPAPITFYATPGKLLWSTVPGSGGIRCQYTTSNGLTYAVRGNKVNRYNSGAWIELATLATNTGQVIAADNGIYVIFVDGTTTAPACKLTDDSVVFLGGDGWYGADFVRFIDGYFIFNHPLTQQFYITGAYDLIFDPLDFASAEANPDNIISILDDHRQLLLFGARTLEIFDDGGGTDFPFVRANGTIIQQGCAAPYSPARFDNSIVWLGNNSDGDCIVWRMNGYTPIRISTHALENEFREYATVSDAFAFVYQENGHTFYVLTFPTENKTWCFDAASNLWHQRAYRDSNNNLLRDRANCHTFYNRQHLVGDFENGNIYQLDIDTYTDNGDVIQRIKSFQHFTNDGHRQFFSKFEVDIQAGVGSALETDPQMTLRCSNDGGNTWPLTQVRSLGLIGEYNTRVSFDRLGMGRDRIFELSTTAIAPIAFQGAFINMTVGTT